MSASELQFFVSCAEKADAGGRDQMQEAAAYWAEAAVIAVKTDRMRLAILYYRKAAANLTDNREQNNMTMYALRLAKQRNYPSLIHECVDSLVQEELSEPDREFVATCKADAAP